MDPGYTQHWSTGHWGCSGQWLLTTWQGSILTIDRCVLRLEWQAVCHLVPIPELLPRDAHEPQLLLQQVTSRQPWTSKWEGTSLAFLEHSS